MKLLCPATLATNMLVWPSAAIISLATTALSAVHAIVLANAYAFFGEHHHHHHISH
jgi:hypothetical protein